MCFFCPNSKNIFCGAGIFSMLEHWFSGANDEVWVESPIRDENVEP